MKRAFVNDWIELIRPLFPPSAKIESDEGNDVVLRIDWELSNDPDRPSEAPRGKPRGIFSAA